MASGTADLQRDLGGSVMQALLGTILTIGYASAFTAQINASAAADQVSEATQNALTQSYSSAAALAERYPEYQAQIIQAAQQSFIDGANWAYAAGALAVVAGAILVAIAYPRLSGERQRIAEYEAADGGGTGGAPSTAAA